MFSRWLRVASFAAAAFVAASGDCFRQPTAPIKVDQGLTYTEPVQENVSSRAGQPRCG